MHSSDDSAAMTRRTFGAATLGGALGAGLAGKSGIAATARGARASGTGMSLGVSHQNPNRFSDDYLRYLRQMGVESLEVRIPAADSSYDRIVAIKRQIEDAGLNVFEIMLADEYMSPSFTLGLDDRDEKIADFRRFIRDLGRAGIDTTTYAWYTGGVYSTGDTISRECRVRDFKLSEALARPNAFDREYSDEEMWDTYEYFIRQVLPAAEDAGVRLQLHPNDPPVNHQGVARIFRSTAAFRRAMEIADHSPYSGILFCVGCFGEMCGPDGSLEDVEQAIYEFGSRGHIYQVHFRNVSSPMPDFYETFPDLGYLDMYRIMRALGEVGFDGMVVPDHVPQCDNSVAGPRAGEAYTFGYIRALMQAVESELG